VSRADLLAAARGSDLALEFETLARQNGADMGSIARRSSSGWTLKVTGKQGHSSGIFSEGSGAGASTSWPGSSTASGGSCRSPI
jgi:glutamate carboxypeptidase